MAGEVATLLIRINGREIVVATGQLKAMQTAAKNLTKETDRLKDKTTEFAGRSKRNFLELGSSLKTVGRDLSRYITLPFTIASASALKFASDLTTGLGNVETLIAGSGSRIYELSDAVKDLSKETGTSFDSLTRGLYETISAFQDGADTIGRFEVATKAAVAGNADVLDSVKLVSAVTKAYGDTSEEAAQKVADLAFEAVRLGQTTFKELSSSIQGVTAVAHAMGVSQEELFSVYATLTGVTGDAAEVTTGFSRALISLMNPTEALSALMANYQNSQGEAVKSGQEFIEVMGGAVPALQEIVKVAEATGTPLNNYITRITGVKVALELAGGQMDAFVQKSSEVADATGAMEKAYFAATTGIDAYQRILKQVKQTLASVGAEMGQVILPIVVTVAKQIANAAERFSELDDATQGTILRAFALAAAIGPLTVAFGSLLRVVKLFGDLKILFAAGQLGFLLNPVTLLAIAAGVTAIAVAFGKWYKQTQLQVAALKELRSASLAVQDANTAFYDYYNSLEDVNGATQVNVEGNEALKRIFPEVSEVIDGTTTSFGNLYEQMLKVRALEMQKELSSNFEILNQKNAEYLDNLEKQNDRIAFIDKRWSGTLEDLGTNVQALAKIYADNPVDFQKYLKDSGLDQTSAENFTTLIADYWSWDEAIKEGEADIKDYLSAMKSQVEAGTGGLLTTESQFSKYIGGLFSVVTNASLESGKQSAENFNNGFDATFGQGQSERLKTWADYFAEITGIAGEAFAKYEYDDEGNIVGFFKGQGILAADAYGKAFSDELKLSGDIATALGQSFNLEDHMGTIEDQLETTVSDITELLSTKVHKLNEEGLDFDVADLLTGDQASKESMLKVFGFDDNSIQEMLSVAKGKIEEFTATATAYAIESISTESERMPKFFGEDMFGFPDNGVERLQENIETINDLIARINAVGGDAAKLELVKDDQLNKLKEASVTYSNILSDLERAPSLGSQYGNAMFEAFKRTGEGAELFNTELAALSSIMEGMINAMVAGLTNIASGMGEVVGEWAAGVETTGKWDDALGSLAISLAETLSQLAIQAGLMLITAGASTYPAVNWALIGMGSALMAGGLAGTFVTSAVKSYAETSSEENATGGVYSGSEKLTKYAKGGVLSDYVNTVVNRPTYFANGSAVMGEAGAEAILPLTRMSSGDLGVQATGSAETATVSININNYASDSTEATATQNSDGSIDINIIKKMVISMIADGSADSAMRSRYGTKVKGIN